MNFYQSHLNRVSRSFSFCIEQLDSPFREWISASYLLLRLLDTVEDSKWLAADDQRKAYDIFKTFLTEPPESIVLQSWISSFPQSARSEELLLVNESAELFNLFHSLEPEVRQQIRDTANEMAFGMQKFGKNLSSSGLELKSDLETDEYCNYVAGIVGRLILNLYRLRHPVTQKYDPRTESQAMAFGRVLQKINMIKDRQSDLNENRNFISSWPSLFKSLLRDLDEAVIFIGHNFSENSSLRVFCAWSLGIGIDFLNRTLSATERLNGSDLTLLLARLFEVAQNQKELKTFFDHRLDEVRRLILSKSNLELPA